jgi:hypothetical protein
LTSLYAAFFAAQLALIGVGLPISAAIVLRSRSRASDAIARVFGTWRGRVALAVPLALVVLLAPLPAALGLMSAANASAPGARWPVDGWIVYLTAPLTSLTLLWLVVGFERLTAAPDARSTPRSPRAPMIVTSPPQGVGFVWEQGVRVIGEQLNTADALDRKIAPLVAATIATAAIVVGQKDSLGDFTGVLVLELAVTAIYFVFALVVRTFQTVPRLAVIAPYASASALQLQFAFLGNLLQASAHNDEALSGKTVLFNAAIAAVFVFLGTGFFAIQRVAR